MDRLSLLGLLLAFAAIVGGQLMEGGRFASLVQFTAFFIVIGGTLAAVLLQSSLESFTRGIKMALWVVQPPKLEFEILIRNMVGFSNTARRGGLLSLENALLNEHDLFIKRALQMLVDGAEPEAIRHTMELEISAYEEELRGAAKIWEAAGGYAPTIGILGAVMGLIHVMENLTDPAKLGSGIAVAFVATIYGVGSANLFFLPVANKLKMLIGKEIKRREMITEGMVAVANGENPRILETKLRGFVV